MEYITLNNGVKMPLSGLGTWDLRGRECIDSILTAIDCGYRLIDTAQMYGNEKEVGEAIRQTSVKREELFITTKIYGNSSSYEKAKKAVTESLANLKTDYIDLLLLHEPYHEETEMYRALEEALQQGYVRAIGISNYNKRRYNAFLKHCNVIPAVNQVECHMYFQKHNLETLMQENGTAMQAWSPLAQAKTDITTNEVLRSIGEKYNKTAAQVSLRSLTQRGISVIPKSKHAHRLRENIDIYDFTLTEEEQEMIRSLDRNKTLFPWTEAF